MPGFHRSVAVLPFCIPCMRKDVSSISVLTGNGSGSYGTEERQRYNGTSQRHNGTAERKNRTAKRQQQNGNGMVEIRHKSRPHWRRSRQNVAVDFLSPVRATKSRWRHFVDFHASVDEPLECSWTSQMTQNKTICSARQPYRNRSVRSPGSPVDYIGAK